MRYSLTATVIASLAFASPLVATAAPRAWQQSGAKQQQVKLQKGTWWGSVGDRVEAVVKETMSNRTLTATVTKIDADKGIVTVETEIDGKKVVRPIFASSIVSMKTIGQGAPATPGTPSAASPGAAGTVSGAKSGNATATAPAGGAPTAQPSAKPSGKVDAQGFQLDENGYRISTQKGVFLLPWSGGVGQTARAFEIEQVAKEADKWGPGQIIILDIDSPGGLVTEIFKISETIGKIRERHRVVAWIREAISAAAVTSMHCDEIYFRSMGALGAAMMIRGRDSAYGQPLDQFRDEIGAVVEKNGRPRMVFEAMVLAKAVLTYTKDPVTGKVTWHDKITGMPGEVVLSDEKDNLTFNASNALDSGFSKGTADTPEEMAKLLGLSEWHETSEYGEKVGNGWKKLFEECEKDLAYQIQRMEIPRAGGAEEQLAVQIQILEKIISWHKRCAPCVEGKGVDIDQLKKQLKQMQKQLADTRKRNASGGN